MDTRAKSHSESSFDQLPHDLNLFLSRESREGGITKGLDQTATTAKAAAALATVLGASPHIAVAAAVAGISILALKFLYGKYQKMYDFISFRCRMLLMLVSGYVGLCTPDTLEHISFILYAFSTTCLRKHCAWKHRELCRKNSFLAWWQATKKWILRGPGFMNSSPKWILCTASKRRLKIWFWSTQPIQIPTPFHNPHMLGQRDVVEASNRRVVS